MPGGCAVRFQKILKRFILSQWVRRLAIGAAVLLVLLTLFVTLSPQGRTGFHTALFVSQVLNMPWKPQSWFTKEPIRQEVSYPQPNGPGVADIYRIPDGEKRAAVLLFLGANATGRDDTDVINLGKALARAGFVAMFHWSPTMGLQYNIDPNEIENLVWAFEYLKAQDFVDRKRLGLGGFSVGASFALVVAANPRISDDVVFVNAFGPYYDAHDLLLQLASRSRYYQETIEPWDPDRLTMKVLANELIETLPNPLEQDLFTRSFLEDQEPTPAPLPQGQDGSTSAAPSVYDELRQPPAQDDPPTGPWLDLEELSIEARTVYQLLTGTTLEEAERLYQSLPVHFREDMQRISPSAKIANLKARLMIIHDRDDRLIPAFESRRLADALEKRGNFQYTEVLAFKHVRPGSGIGLWLLVRESFKLYRHMYSIIRLAA
jgi:acetyl esterase/lipase